MQVEQDGSAFLSRAFINLKETFEISHWCEELNLRSDELQDIVRRVGANVEEQRDYLVHRSIRKEATF